MKILIVAAHPDDEILGVGGTMVRLKDESHEVRTLIYGIGRGDELDQKFDSIPLLDITKTLEENIGTYRPEVVFTHDANDLNRDHRIIYQATITACRPRPNSSIRKIYSYEVTPYSNFCPNVWMQLSGAQLGKKWNRFIGLYRYEQRQYPHPRSWEAVKIQAQYRGLQVGVEFAEAFKTVRALIC